MLQGKIGWLVKVAGGGLLSFAAPRLLIGSGIPIDQWAAGLGSSLGAGMTLETATWSLTVLLGVLLLAANWWVPGLTNLLLGSKFLGVEDAGAWLYQRASKRVRDAMWGFVPDAFNTLPQSAAAYVREAAVKLKLRLYARRDPKMPMESVTPEDCEANSFDALFDSNATSLHDVSIRRRDLRKVLKYYKI